MWEVRGRENLWPVKFAWIRAYVKSGLPDHPHIEKEWAVMVIALFTSDFPTMQLCDHHILKHKPTPDGPQLTLCTSTLRLAGKTRSSRGNTRLGRPTWSL